MRTCARCGIVLLIAFVLIVGCTGGVRVQAAENALPSDARIKRLLDLHLVLGTPDGDLHPTRQVINGEFVVLLDRVLHQPQPTKQRLGTPSARDEAVAWTRRYAWMRGAWD